MEHFIHLTINRSFFSQFLKDAKLIVKFFQDNTVFVSVVVLVENPTAKTSEHLFKATV